MQGIQNCHFWPYWIFEGYAHGVSGWPLKNNLQQGPISDFFLGFFHVGSITT